MAKRKHSRPTTETEGHLVLDVSTVLSKTGRDPSGWLSLYP